MCQTDAQVHHRILSIGMPQQLLYAHDINPVFQQVGSIAVAQHMRMHFFEDTSLSGYHFYHPLHAPLAVAAVKVATPAAIRLAIKQPVGRMCGCNVFFDATYQMFTQGNIAVFVAFALYNVYQPSVKVKVFQSKVAYFHIA